MTIYILWPRNFSPAIYPKETIQVSKELHTEKMFKIIYNGETWNVECYGNIHKNFTKDN